ncbi:NAD P-binding protein [Gloeophyllum trabeum ATCC 11539]|uniref:NAD P-binding protein n=1 Tax=Gloeophyllum trabeum (strain ATCC 11539 / FP-39264 / Madison 617) TaxID=670483 RepID=S7Q937_GLOTA|nr:NAD P-binding protein [Gloeophyllum trabeum ATCC 11539]EPQ55958.1 NAD P-binding protein [Gloeophyllum trabeum ATCC 11539]
MVSNIPAMSREYRLAKNEGIQSLTLREAPVPTPGDKEVLVKIHAVSLNYRDLLVANNAHPFHNKPNLVPAADASGTVVALGPAVTRWRVGDRISSNLAPDHIHGDAGPGGLGPVLGGSVDGVLTEYRVFAEHSLVRIPANLTHAEAATLPCAGVTAYNALLGPRPVRAGDTVLVLGTGGVSVFALQIARASGAAVIVTSGSDEKLARATQLGATHVINYKKTPDWEEEVLRLTNGRGVDHVIEVGGPGTFDKSIAAVRMQGNIHVIGFLAGAADVPNLPMKILQKGINVRGILVGPRSSFEELVRLVEANDVKPAVDRAFPFEQAREAYAHLQAQRHVGKVVIQVAED